LFGPGVRQFQANVKLFDHRVELFDPGGRLF
jgi:hypothetical protein